MICDVLFCIIYAESKFWNVVSVHGVAWCDYVLRQACYCQPGLPSFFCAEGADLVEGAAAALDSLGQEGQRGYILVRDETVFAKSFSLIYGLVKGEPQQGIVVGGIHPKHSMIRAGADVSEGQPLILDKDTLSTISVVTAIKRIDKRGDLFELQHLPRNKVVDAEGEFRAFGELAQACVLAKLCQVFPFIRYI